MRTPFTLIIMDGYGLSDDVVGNAVKAARTPNLDKLFAECPNTLLSASGMDVGLPAGQIGNSEVGHTNIGAGRIVFQDLPKINNAIEDETFFENPAYVSAMDSCRDRDAALHIMGLMSDGGVHSHNTHTWALLEMAKRCGLKKVFVHCFLDGRDVAPTSGRDFVAECVEKCKEIGVGQIATVMGRFYAMDRDRRWERVKEAYDALVCGEGRFSPDPVKAVEESYAAGITDEFVKPIICTVGCEVSQGDSVIFSNFRPDRAREITRALVDPGFDGFERAKGFFPLHYVCTTQYDETMPNVQVAFPPRVLKGILGEFLSKNGLTQLRIAETEKYAHVTFFFNGGQEQVFPGEDRVLIPSPKVETYDLQPEMSAYEVTEEAVKRINSGEYDVIILNFANCDMVGHTGMYEAAVKAVETVDECVERIVRATSEMGGMAIITADHGNAEKMLAEDSQQPHTAHTTNLVPFLICGAAVELRENGILADIAPTILDLMGFEQPEEMTGSSLIL